MTGIVDVAGVDEGEITGGGVTAAIIGDMILPPPPPPPPPPLLIKAGAVVVIAMGMEMGNTVGVLEGIVSALATGIDGIKSASAASILALVSGPK